MGDNENFGNQDHAAAEGDQYEEEPGPAQQRNSVLAFDLLAIPAIDPLTQARLNNAQSGQVGPPVPPRPRINYNAPIDLLMSENIPVPPRRVDSLREFGRAVAGPSTSRADYASRFDLPLPSLERHRSPRIMTLMIRNALKKLAAGARVRRARISTPSAWFPEIRLPFRARSWSLPPLQSRNILTTPHHFDTVPRGRSRQPRYEVEPPDPIHSTGPEAEPDYLSILGSTGLSIQNKSETTDFLLTDNESFVNFNEESEEFTATQLAGQMLSDVSGANLSSLPTDGPSPLASSLQESLDRDSSGGNLASNESSSSDLPSPTAENILFCPRSLNTRIPPSCPPPPYSTPEHNGGGAKPP